MDGQTWRVLRFTQYAEKGAWPVSGGVLDQSHSFLLAAEFALTEQAHHKADISG